MGRRRQRQKREQRQDDLNLFHNPANGIRAVTAAYGGTAASGIKVTESSAMGYAPVWQGLTAIAGDVAKMPIHLYRKTDDGREKATGHPVYRLLNQRPNRYMTAYNFKEAMAWRMKLRGNAYAVILRDNNGTPVELVPIADDIVKPEMINGEVWYWLAAGNGAMVPQEDMLHWRGIGDGICGISLLERARETLGLGIATRDYGATFFANGARPSGIFEHPRVMDDETYEQFRQAWQSMHGGVNNAHKLLILQQGMKFTPLDVNHEEAQFLQTREFTAREVASFLNIPPHKVGDSTRTSFASLEQENQSYLDSLDPMLVNLEEECVQKLLTPQEARTMYAEFNRNVILRIDYQTRISGYASAIREGWMTRNEVRERENMPRREGLDEFLLPQNMALQGEDGDITPLNEPSHDGVVEDDARAVQPRTGIIQHYALAELMRSTASRLIHNFGDRAVRAAKDGQAYQTFVDNMRQTLRARVMEAWAAPALVFASAYDSRNIDCGMLTDYLLDNMHEAFEAVLDTPHETLKDTARATAERVEDELPRRMVAEILGE